MPERPTRRALLSLSLTLPLARAQKNKQEKGPEVELLEAAAHLEDRRILVDGRVRNAAARPVRELNLILEVLDSDRRVLTKQHGPIGESVLEPGGEAPFHTQIHYHARAVFVRISFEDGGGRELTSDSPEPFPIE